MFAHVNILLLSGTGTCEVRRGGIILPSLRRLTLSEGPNEGSNLTAMRDRPKVKAFNALR